MTECRKATCPGHYEHRLVTRAEQHAGKTVVIERVPAEVCDTCGEVFFTSETAERLEALRDELETGQARPASTAEVYHLTRGEPEWTA